MPRPVISSTAPARVSSSSSTAPARSSSSSPIPSGPSASLCFILYGLPGSIDYPFSIAYSLRATYSSSTTTTSAGTAVTVYSVSGTRTYTNRFGASSSVGISQSSSSSLLYLNSAVPFDVNGLTLSTSSPVQQPGGNGPAALVSQLTLSNVSGVVVEAGTYRLDQFGSAFLSSVPGFTNVSIGAANVNSLSVNYPGCTAPVTFSNGLRAPTQPSTSMALSPSASPTASAMARRTACRPT